jgi:hypothetical protein
VTLMLLLLLLLMMIMAIDDDDDDPPTGLPYLQIRQLPYLDEAYGEKAIRHRGHAGPFETFVATRAPRSFLFLAHGNQRRSVLFDRRHAGRHRVSKRHWSRYLAHVWSTLRVFCGCSEGVLWVF